MIGSVGYVWRVWCGGVWVSACASCAVRAGAELKAAPSLWRRRSLLFSVTSLVGGGGRPPPPFHPSKAGWKRAGGRRVLVRFAVWRLLDACVQFCLVGSANRRNLAAAQRVSVRSRLGTRNSIANTELALTRKTRLCNYNLARRWCLRM